jgi:putative ABC transport system permease protein
MREWVQDLRYGARMILKRPGTSAIAIVALALGIGLTTMMFSIVEGVILRGLPFDESDRIVAIVRTPVKAAGRETPPLHDLVDWRARQKVFELLSAHAEVPATFATETGLPERRRAARITTNTLSLLRVAPIVGRDFSEADGVPGAAPVVLIGYRLWESVFRSDPNVAGTTVRVDGKPSTVVGVLPPKFGFPEAEEIWLPADLTLPAKRGEGFRLNVLGRLRDGVTLERAQTEMAAIAQQLAAAYPENKDTTVRVSPFMDENIPPRIRNTFYSMMVAVLGVMLIACVNVTNLQLARAADRTKEFAIRTALGSGRWRIVRQSLAEGLVLAAVGAAIGLGTAQYGVIYFMEAIADTQPPFWIDVRLDFTVLAFVTAITVAAALVSSVVPGLRIARADAHAVLKDDTRGATSVRMGRFGRWLVVVEVTVSCVLLVVSGLMIRSIVRTSRIDYPFATRDVFFALTRFDERVHADMPAAVRAIERFDEALARLPGVRRAALATALPGNGGTPRFTLEGQTFAKPEDRPRVMRIAATPALFDVLGVELRQGRFFGPGDTATAEPVGIVDDAFAARYLAGGPILGRRLRFDEKSPWITIVGVIPNLVQAQRPDQVVESIYVPFSQLPQRSVVVLARTGNDPLSVTAGVRSALVAVSPDTAINRANSLAGEFWRGGWPFRLFGGLFLMFGAAALVLAAAGLYGVLAFTVRRRTQEIGVRMALGASRRSMLRMVLWQGLWRVALGVVLGLWPGWFLGTQMRELLSNVSAADPVVHVTTAVTLLLAGGLASLVPALRASSVDPLTALRRD